jgi:hypothetical protein
MMGEWNSLVGDKSYQKTFGPHRLERRQHRRKAFVYICERNGLDMTKGWLKKPKRRFYT